MTFQASYNGFGDFPPQPKYLKKKKNLHYNFFFIYIKKGNFINDHIYIYIIIITVERPIGRTTLDYF